MRFLLVTQPDLDETNALFRAGCAARGLPIVELCPGASAGLLSPTDGPRLIYRAATDRAARLLELLLARQGDLLLHDPAFIYTHQPIVLRNAGVPVAKAVYQPAEEATTLAQQAAWLGGFPVVVKRSGNEGGAGVTLALDTDDLVRQLAESPAGTEIEAFVPHDRCWRVTVLAGRALAMTAYAPADGDFRSNAAGGHYVPDADPPNRLEAVAVAAVTALKLEFGGVDVMETPDGDLLVAEVNFPCFFAQQQFETGTDIAGAIVDHLTETARGA